MPPGLKKLYDDLESILKSAEFSPAIDHLFIIKPIFIPENFTEKKSLY